MKKNNYKCKDIKEKEMYDKFLIINLVTKYSLENKSIQEIINKLDYAFVSEKEVSGIPEKINFYGEKIKIATRLFPMKKMYKENRFEDIIAIVNYIEDLLNKIKEEIIK